MQTLLPTNQGQPSARLRFGEDWIIWQLSELLLPDRWKNGKLTTTYSPCYHDWKLSLPFVLPQDSFAGSWWQGAPWDLYQGWEGAQPAYSGVQGDQLLHAGQVGRQARVRNTYCNWCCDSGISSLEMPLSRSTIRCSQIYLTTRLLHFWLKLAQRSPLLWNIIKQQHLFCWSNLEGMFLGL